MSKDLNPPKYAGEVPFAPVNWDDRDAIVGRLMGILEAVLPEGKKLEATKGLVKNSLSDFFKDLFNQQYEALNSDYEKYDALRVNIQVAIWEASQGENITTK